MQSLAHIRIKLKVNSEDKSKLTSELFIILFHLQVLQQFLPLHTGEHCMK